MKGYVTSEPVVPVVPEQSVTLNLTVEEFALIRAVVYQCLDGTSTARHTVILGFEEVIESLNPHWQHKVLEAGRVVSNFATNVRKVFAAGRSDS